MDGSQGKVTRRVLLRISVRKEILHPTWLYVPNSLSTRMCKGTLRSDKKLIGMPLGLGPLGLRGLSKGVKFCV